MPPPYSPLVALSESPAFPLPLPPQIPALVLDCDADVDVERDLEYREHVAMQVKQYTEYVRSLTKSRANAKFEVWV